MKEEIISDALLRQFLLGKVNDEERQRIESLFLTDSVIRERVLAVEQDLVEDYLEDSLSPGDKERFLSHYAQTPEQERKLRITKSIKDWAVTESAEGAGASEALDVDQRNRSSISLWGRLLEGLRARPASVIPIAAVIVLVLVFAVIWVNRRLEQRRHSAIEQEIARLNDPSGLRNVPRQADALVLTPITLRSNESQSELKLSSDEPFVELHLRWIQRERYPRYEAVVRRIGDDKLITIPNLQAEDGDRKTIRLLLPSRILSKGLYQVYVSGLNDGSASPAEEYQFSVAD